MTGGGEGVEKAVEAAMYLSTEGYKLATRRLIAEWIVGTSSCSQLDNKAVNSTRVL